MSKSHSFDRLDFDAVWSALSRSKQLRSRIEQVARDTKAACESTAKQVANDEGYYANSFDTATVTGKQARAAFDTKARRRRGAAQGANRFIDRTNGDPDGGNYQGSLATVYNSDFKARWIEFGSIAKGPRMVMATAGKKTAAENGGDYEQIYDAAYQQDLTELARRISKGKQA